ncbi:MAG: hypothetical protein N3F10_02290 [Candidatus Bathyarchaeota archaeon]|nr:hypothetical protein [Candidatus Bathyarchaeota archaeon]MCX8177113.1 hypothetical protein [Candidatus Bathyarchaeota archaeon]MDW8193717.1 hypothetical protein [Nitrososphaerota archaeon]
MSKRKAYYAGKLKRAVHLLFFRRHKKPGVKGWELRRALGSDYPKVLKILDEYLKPLDLQVKTVFEEGVMENPSAEQLDQARFYIALRGELTPKEAKMIGWRIDDLAGLAVTLAYLVSKGGKAPRREVEALLQEKLPGWRASLNIDRYIRYGYLAEDEGEQLYLDWRARAEVDLKALADLLLSAQSRNDSLIKS